MQTLLQETNAFMPSQQITRPQQRQKQLVQHQQQHLVPQQHHHLQQQQCVCDGARQFNHHQQLQFPYNAVLHRRRDLLFGGIAAGVGIAAVATPACDAAVTVTIRPKVTLKPYTLKAGYTVTVPDTWGLAYDRSVDEKAGTQAFFGNFKTFETLAIFKVARPEGDLSPQQLLEWVLAEQKNNQSTFDFKLLSGETPTQRTAPAADSTNEDTYYDSEYSLAICRGVIQEGAGGSKRCIGPRDMDLEVVSRTFYQAFTVRQDNIYIIRGSSTTQQWQNVQEAAREAVQSFRLPAGLA